MKVYIGPYVDRWVSYVHVKYMNKRYGYLWPEYGQKGLTNKVEPFREALLERLEDTLQWVYNYSINAYLDRKERKQTIRIDRWDTWSMDHTLAPIILPMLIQLRATKHGSPRTDDEDVPYYLRSTTPPKENNHDVDKFHHARWDWILDEMIWAFEQKARDDWEDDYYRYEEDPESMFGLKCVWSDPEGLKAHQTRMSNGFRLFGKYYEALWD